MQTFDDREPPRCAGCDFRIQWTGEPLRWTTLSGSPVCSAFGGGFHEPRRADELRALRARVRELEAAAATARGGAE